MKHTSAISHPCFQPQQVTQWMSRHPRASFCLVLVGAPTCMVGAVAACCATVMLPVSLVLGWL